MPGLEESERGVPRFEALAPLLDRLRELAERELPANHMVRVEGWADGSFHAKADHSHGIIDEETGKKMYERVAYDREQEAFVYGFVRWTDDRGELERDLDVLEPYPDPTV